MWCRQASRAFVCGFGVLVVAVDALAKLPKLAWPLVVVVVGMV
jgi:hypothetical protein